MKHLLTLLVSLLFLPALGQSAHHQAAINALKEHVLARDTRPSYDSLHALIINEYAQLSADQRNDIRKTLDNQARWSSGNLCTDQEQGTRISVSGRIVDRQGKAIPNARLAIYQADRNGYYAPSDAVTHKMSENDPRLFSYLRTDQAGIYHFQTVRPASYPIQYNGRTIPQHIHINCTANGYKSTMVQLVFADDPTMSDPYWRSWAVKQGYPVAELKAVNGTDLQANCNLVLTKQ